MFKDERVQAGKEYEYRVAAINDGGESEPSDPSKPIKAKPLKGTLSSCRHQGLVRAEY